MKIKCIWLVAALLFIPGSSFLFSADFSGNGDDNYAVFRPATSLWAIRGYTRCYFGQRGDIPLAYKPSGYTRSYPTIFRPSSGLFAVRGVTRLYYGSAGDIPIGEGYNPSSGAYDYVVRPGDADDLVAALESTDFTSVFVPEGTYTVNDVINVTYVRHITGEDKRRTVIRFTGNNFLLVDEDYCHLENMQFEHGTTTPSLGSLVQINGKEWVVVENCRFDGNDYVNQGLAYTGTSHWLQVLNCYAIQCTYGFGGNVSTYGTTFSNCQARNCAYGFSGCENLSSCVFRGGSGTQAGFTNCNRLAACKSVNMGVGFDNCKYISASQVDGSAYSSDAGYRNCKFISSSEAYGCSWGFQTCDGISSSAAQSCSAGFPGCNYRDTGSTWL